MFLGMSGCHSLPALLVLPEKAGMWEKPGGEEAQITQVGPKIALFLV